MFIKITESGGRRYAKLAEAYRDEKGVSRQRIIANLGRVDALHNSDNALGKGLKRLCFGDTDSPDSAPVISEFNPALSVGATWLLHSLWKQLGFSNVFRSCLLSAHPGFDAEALLKVMVFNRLCDPESKLGILRWMESTLVPGIPLSAVTHQRLLRTMDTLGAARDLLDERLAAQIKPLIDKDLSVVFYDLTTLRAEGNSSEEDDLRYRGLSKEGGFRRQCLLGVVQTSEGLPIYHEVFTGNTAETKTLLPTFKKVITRYQVKRLILVADRGLLSLDNLDELLETRLDDGSPLEFILAVPGRRYGEFQETLKDFHQRDCMPAKKEVVGEIEWKDQRLVIAHDPELAGEATATRDRKIADLEALAAELATKLDAQDEGIKHRGRKLSEGGAMARFYNAIMDAQLSKVVKLDLSSELFTYDIDNASLEKERMLDGKLLLITNVRDLDSAEVVARYKALADIERGFRVLKNELEIVPMYHRLPDRIRSHALICFVALIMHRVLRMRLKDKKSPLSPERALEVAGRIQYHNVTLGDGSKVKGLSRLDDRQMDLFAAIEIPKPIESEVADRL